MARPCKEEREIVLNRAIAEANDEGRLGFIPYVIPGFPSARDYLATLDLLNANPAVSIVETTILVTTGFSDHANETIRRAHIQAAGSKEASAIPRPGKPALCVLYKATAEARGFESVLSDTLGQFEGVLLEWEEEDESSYVAMARKHGLELVQCVGPWMSFDLIQRVMERSDEQPLVYVMSAPMTGAQLFSNQELDKCIREAKRHRPAAKVAAGFGVRNGHDVRRLAEIDGLDAVIIGTAFLQAMGEGTEATARLLEEIEAALER